MPGMSGIELAQHMLKLPHLPAHHLSPPPTISLRCRHFSECGRLSAQTDQAGTTGGGTGKGERVTALPPAVKISTRKPPVSQRHRAWQGAAGAGQGHSVPQGRAEIHHPGTAQREYLLEEIATHLEQEVEQAFVRIHRNLPGLRAAITGFERHSSDEGDSHWEVLLHGIDEHLPISRRQQAIVRVQAPGK